MGKSSAKSLINAMQAKFPANKKNRPKVINIIIKNIKPGCKKNDFYCRTSRRAERRKISDTAFSELKTEQRFLLIIAGSGECEN